MKIIHTIDIHSHTRRRVPLSPPAHIYNQVYNNPYYNVRAKTLKYFLNDHIHMYHNNISSNILYTFTVNFVELTLEIDRIGAEKLHHPYILERLPVQIECLSVFRNSL